MTVTLTLIRAADLTPQMHIATLDGYASRIDKVGFVDGVVKLNILVHDANGVRAREALADQLIAVDRPLIASLVGGFIHLVSDGDSWMDTAVEMSREQFTAWACRVGATVDPMPWI